MNIAFFSDIFYPELSGISDTILATGTELAKRGHRVTYFVPRYSMKDYETGDLPLGEPDYGPGIKVERLRSFSFSGPNLQGRFVVPNIFRSLNTQNTFDIIHTQSPFSAGLDALLFAKMKRIPIIGTNHTLIESFTAYSPIQASWLPGLLEKFFTWYYNRCNLVTAPSDFLIRHMQERKLTSPAMYVSNPIEDSFFATRALKKKLKKELSFPPFTVLYVGRISQEKNIGTLIDAFIPFAKKNPDASLVLVGQGSLRKDLEIKARASGLGSRISFMGPFLGAKKATLYDIFHAADVFVMPSTSETQSMVTLQAMASKLPIIAADIGPLSALVGKKNGLLFSPYETEELRQRLDDLYASSLIRNKFGKNGAVFAKQFSTSHIADAWEKIYTDTITLYGKK